MFSDGSILLHGTDQVLRALSPRGTIDVLFAFPDGTTAVALGPNDTIYGSTSDGRLISRAKSGSVRFDVALTSSSLSPPTVIMSDGSCYIASRDGTLFHVSSTGDVLRSRNVVPVLGSPVSVDGQGQIYVAGLAGVVQAFRPDLELKYLSLIHISEPTRPY